MIVKISSFRISTFCMKKCLYKKVQVSFWGFMTSMSDLSRVQSETLSDKPHSTRRGTDFIKGPENRGKKRSLLPHATRAAANYQFPVQKIIRCYIYSKKKVCQELRLHLSGHENERSSVFVSLKEAPFLYL